MDAESEKQPLCSHVAVSECHEVKKCMLVFIESTWIIVHCEKQKPKS